MMGKAARFARSGQGINVVRSENAGAKISRGANRGRPLDIARDAREGDFIPIGPGASRQPRMKTQAALGNDTAQAAGIDNAAIGKLERGEPRLNQRSLLNPALIIGGKGKPEGELVMPPKSPFLPALSPKISLKTKEPKSFKEAVGVEFGNRQVLGTSSAQGDSGGEGASGSFGREPRFLA